MSEDITQQLLVARMDRLISVAEETNTRLQDVEKRLQNVEESQDALKAQFENLDAKVEKRLQNTRPIWESVQSRLTDLDKKVDGIGELRTEMESRLTDLDKKVDGIGELRTEMESRFTKLERDNQELRTEMASGFRSTVRKIGVVMENLVGLTADIRELQDRIEKLESHPV